MRYKAAIALSVLMGSAEGCVRRPPRSLPSPTVSSHGDWLAAEAGACGEVRGRVIDARSGQPLVGAMVDVDSGGRAVMTDSLGHFRLRLPSDTTGLPSRGTTLRIRRIGFFELRFYLPPGLGYTIDASLAARGNHTDHLNIVRLKDFGFCARAT